MGKAAITRLSRLPRLFEGQYAINVLPCCCASPDGVAGGFCFVCGNAMPTAEESVMLEHERAVVAAKTETEAAKRRQKYHWCSSCHKRSTVEINGKRYCGQCCNKAFPKSARGGMI